MHRSVPGRISIAIDLGDREFQAHIGGNAARLDIVGKSVMDRSDTCSQQPQFSGVPGLPVISPSLTYRGNPVIDPKGEIIAIAASSASDWQVLHQYVLLIQRSTSTVVGQVAMESGEAIECVAWSPDSRGFAVLTSVGHIQTNTLKGFLLHSVGHPAWIHDFSVAWFDGTGTMHGKAKLLRNAPSNRAQMSWNQK